MERMELMVSSFTARLIQQISAHFEDDLQAWSRFSACTQDSWLPLLTTELKRCGFTFPLVPEASSIVYAELQANAPCTLLFYNHVPAFAPARWQLLSLFLWLRVFSLYTKLGRMSPVNVKWLLDSSTLTDDTHLLQALEKLPQLIKADICLTDDTAGIGTLAGETPLLATGLKGLLCVELHVQTGVRSLPSMHGAIAPNAAWRLLWALNRLKDEREDIQLDGFYETLEDLFVDDVARLPDRSVWFSRHWGVESLLGGLQGFQANYAHVLTPTCTINRISSGDGQALTIPAQAEATLDFHLVPGQKPAVVLEALQQHLKTEGFAEVEVSPLAQVQPCFTTPSHHLIERLRHATTLAYARETCVLPLALECKPIATLCALHTLPLACTALRIGESEVSSAEMQAAMRQLVYFIESFV